MTTQPDRQIPAGVQFAFTWAVIVAQLAMNAWLTSKGRSGDTDDAMRLVELRSFLAGRGWFDLHEPRVAPPLGYDTHWSRLVDGGLAGLYKLFGLFTGPEQADVLMHLVWPLLWLGVALAAMMAIARRLAGDNGLLAAGFIAMLGFQAYVRFLPGVIDHHSVQISLSLVVLWLVITSDTTPRAAAAAGVVTAVALAVGLESIVFLAIAALALAVRFVLDARQGRALALYGGGLAAGLICVSAGTVAPSRWLGTACDALGFNLAAPLVLAGFGAALLAVMLPPQHRGLRLVAMLGLAAATGAAILYLQPRCLAGPFEMVDAVAKRDWLDRVGESLPLVSLQGGVRAPELVLPLFVMSLVAMLLLAVGSLRRSTAFLTVFAVFAAATAIAVTDSKISSYALWFAMPLMALAAARIWSWLGLSRLWLKAVIAALLAPYPYAVAYAALMPAPAATAPQNAQSGANQLCTSDDYAALASLPSGLVLANTDAGPFILLTTPHAVVSAPYHRLSRQIMQSFHSFSLDPAAAEAEVLAMGASYIVVCKGAPLNHFTGNDAPTSLAAALLAGHAPAWLTPVAGMGDNLLVYRTRLAPQP